MWVSYDFYAKLVVAKLAFKGTAEKSFKKFRPLTDLCIWCPAQHLQLDVEFTVKSVGNLCTISVITLEALHITKKKLRL